MTPEQEIIKEKAKKFQEHKLKVGYELEAAICLTDGFVLGYHQSQQDNEQRIKELEEGIKIGLEAMNELGNFQDGWEEEVLKLESLIKK